jgi:hypothetical protein
MAARASSTRPRRSIAPMIAAGQFLDVLYYRLKVIYIEMMPPACEERVSRRRRAETRTDSGGDTAMSQLTSLWISLRPRV